jgi:hypothetical protein
MDQARADAHHLVGGNTRSHSAATNGHAAIYPPASDCAGQLHNKIRIIIVQGRLSVAKIDHLMTGLAQHPDQMLL